MAGAVNTWSAGMPHKLLLADDSVTIQRVIELTFADEDVQVLAVGDGRQAIDRIAAERPDIVLADVGMPGQDGYEVAAFVKQTAELSHIPVLLLTGAFEPVDEERAARCRCDGVLAKPFEPQQLIARVKSLLGNRPASAREPAREPALVESGRQPASTPHAPPPEVADQLRAAPPSDGSRNTPAEDLELIAPTPPRDRSSLDDYFDRLDAAFANLSGSPAATDPIVGPDEPAGGLRIEEATWGGVAKGDTAPDAAVVVPEPAAKGIADRPAPLTGLQVFSALLDAEQRHEPWPEMPGPTSPTPDVAPEAWVDRVAEAVVARLADRETRSLVVQTVREVAERLVREEIDRLKARVEASR